MTTDYSSKIIRFDILATRRLRRACIAPSMPFSILDLSSLMMTAATSGIQKNNSAPGTWVRVGEVFFFLNLVLVKL